MFKLNVIVLVLSFVFVLNFKFCASQYYQQLQEPHPFHNHHHHHHQHNHQHPFVHNHGNFEGSGHQYPNVSLKSSKYIPMNVYQQMDSYTDMSELLEQFVDGYKKEEYFIDSRFDRSGASGSVPIKAKCPKCEPELHTVEIVMEEDDPNAVYIPKCVRIERCGGCCASKIQSCQPIGTENVLYEIQKLEYFEKGKFKKAQSMTKVVEKHTKCKCDCKIKEKDCNRYQIYNRAACSCICGNFEDEYRCYEENAIKIWELETCSCRCKDGFECSTGFIFDLITCKCMPMPFAG